MSARLAAAAVLAGLSMNAAGGLSTAPATPSFDAAQVVALAKAVEREVARRGAVVFLLARVGRPPAELPPGIRYTHTGIGVYSKVDRDDGSSGHTYLLHSLYQRDSAPGESILKSDFLYDYFLGAKVLRAGVVIPTPALQRRLLEFVGTDAYRRLHNPVYSAISNPADLRYQNCTEYVLDVLNASIYGTADRAAIKANIGAYFRPQPVEVSGLRLVLGSLFVADIRTGDHAGPVATATFTTIGDYLERYGLAAERFEVEAPDGEARAGTGPR